MAKKAYGKFKVFFHTLLCVIVGLVLAIALLLCVTGHMVLHHSEHTVGQAAAAVHFDEITWHDGMGDKTLAADIGERWLPNSGLTEEQIANVLRDGDFAVSCGSRVWAYERYLKGEDAEMAFPELEPISFAHDVDRNAALFEREGYTFSSADRTRLLGDLEAPVASLNDTMRALLGKDAKSISLRWCFTPVAWIVGGVLMLLLVIRLIFIEVRGQRHVGHAFLTIGLVMGIPCVLLAVASLLSGPILSGVGLAWLQEPFAMLRKAPLMTGGFGAAGSVVIFLFGMVWNQIAGHVADKRAARAAAIEQYDAPTAGDAPAPVYDEDRAPMNAPAPTTVPSPAPIPTPVSTPLPTAVDTKTDAVPETKDVPAPADPVVPDTPAEPAAPRRFCRFCGAQLVNENAQFCYKCGTPQAAPKKDDTDAQ